MNEFPEYRTFGRNAFLPSYYYDPLGREKDSIELTGKTFDEMFGLLEGQTLEQAGTRNTVLLQEGGPESHRMRKSGRNVCRSDGKGGGRLQFLWKSGKPS